MTKDIALEQAVLLLVLQRKYTGHDRPVDSAGRLGLRWII